MNSPIEQLIKQIVFEVVDAIDLSVLAPQKLAYSPEEVAELVGFKNGLAVEREAKSGRLTGCKVRSQWRFTPAQIKDFS